MVQGEFEQGDSTGDTGDELDLSETDSLPWLEADEDDDEGGVDMAQIFGFGAVLLALLLGVVGAIYLLTNRTSADAPVADGSTIEAPEGPIKERPDDPQGKEFAGTGNVAPAVGEGRTRQSQIGSGGSADTGSTVASAAGAADGASGSAQTTPTSGSAASGASEPDAGGASGKITTASSGSNSGVGVQLAAYSSRARAEQGWSQLSRQTDALSGVRYRVVEGVVDGGTVYRLQAVANDRAAADTLCRAIKADGLDCAVKR
ncbi:SPOR domain-containing protein [Erythrobacter insulae]|uniref:SPOR domain-containing protein n=1 Tax=Erythrobacter insulae TaxID=2584124 RepID=A0A547PEV8_9SPHN|nr:SPOR domain-containing protein [Erythrobacter insulae]